jgi:hypothetical protein
MRRLDVAFACLLAALPFSTHAAFFFFLPGSVAGKIADVLTGAEGENCVADSKKVGDLIVSPTGNTATVISLSGTSARCQRPEFPIRARLKYNFSFTSTAGIEVPEGYEQRQLTEFQRFAGTLLRADQPARRIGFVVNARPRVPGSDTAAIANAVGIEMSRLVDDFQILGQEELLINGTKALRFEAEGKNKGVFGPKFTYIVTLLEGEREVLVVNGFAPSKADFTAEREELRRLAFGVKGLRMENGDLTPGAERMPLNASPAMEAIGSAMEGAAFRPGEAPASRPALVETGAGPSGSTSTGAQRSFADRLRDLEALKKDGLVTQQEYEQKRRVLVDGL